ncbi:hypothetical protein FS837_011646 [Tulasnella sp. UAMH 9824]|nr:hypothetical protein FS837_011646 [Tulasnella sp. UAMH 9824]
MEFKPRHPQPFTLEVAAQLSVPEITGEIARLQNSLKHLYSTQTELEPFTSGPEKDPDFTAAYEENKGTIASQEERITMLRFALERKGASAVSNPHYTLPDSATPPASSAPASRPAAANASLPPDDNPDLDESNGLYL